MTERHEDSGGVTLKWIHVIFVFVIQLLLVGAMFGRLSYQTEDNSRRIEKIENSNFLPSSDSINKGEFNEFRFGVINRLNSIESKLDNLMLGENDAGKKRHN